MRQHTKDSMRSLAQHALVEHRNCCCHATGSESNNSLAQHAGHAQHALFKQQHEKLPIACRSCIACPTSSTTMLYPSPVSVLLWKGVAVKPSNGLGAVGLKGPPSPFMLPLLTSYCPKPEGCAAPALPSAPCSSALTDSDEENLKCPSSSVDVACVASYCGRREGCVAPALLAVPCTPRPLLNIFYSCPKPKNCLPYSIRLVQKYKTK